MLYLMLGIILDGWFYIVATTESVLLVPCTRNIKHARN